MGVENPKVFVRVGDVEVSPVTLRDLFAAFALGGLMTQVEQVYGSADIEAPVERAYRYADAMLAERARTSADPQAGA